MLSMLMIRLSIIRMIMNIIFIIMLVIMIKVGSIKTTKGRLSEPSWGKSIGKDENKVFTMMMTMVMMMMSMMMPMTIDYNDDGEDDDDDKQGYDWEKWGLYKRWTCGQSGQNNHWGQNRHNDNHYVVDYDDYGNDNRYHFDDHRFHKPTQEDNYDLVYWIIIVIIIMWWECDDDNGAKFEPGLKGKLATMGSKL